MKAAVFIGPGQLELKEIPTPTAGPGELVLKVGANTICGTDGRILRGEKTAGVRPGVVLGHEISGYVEQIGEGVSGYEIGDLIGVMPAIPCGNCFFCKRNKENLCLQPETFGYALDGGLAEYVKIPAIGITRKTIFKADKRLTPEEVALAEPLGCVINGMHNYDPTLGDTVLIIGAGPIGLLHIQVCKNMGARQIIVSDMSESRRELALKLGASHVIDPSKADLISFVKDLTGGFGADVSVICIGRPELVEDAIMSTRKGGHVNAFAGFTKGVCAQIDPNLIHYGELIITGASNATRLTHSQALQLIEDGIVDVKILHTNTFALDDVIAGIEYVGSGKGVKVAIVPEI